MTDEYRYQKLTWPEINDAVEDDKMIVIPVGSTEDHGPHLPLDVDQVIPENICEGTVQERTDTLLFQTVSHGYLPHHMDAPGGTTIKWHRFVDYLIDIGVSLVHHGFNRILFVNGHGSNHHLVEQASRQINVQYPNAKCGMLSWWQIEEVGETFRDIADGGSRGSGHAGELETSIYLALYPDRVDMEKAVRDISYPRKDHFYATGLAVDPEDSSTPVTMVEWWSMLSETGIKGDASLATVEKGEQFINAAVRGLHSVLDEFGEYPIRDIDDSHVRTVTDDEYDPFRPR